MRRLGIEQPLSYHLHVPMPMNRSSRLKIKTVADINLPHNKGLQWRTLYGNYFAVGGEHIDDVKHRWREDIPGVVDKFLSTNDKTFNNSSTGALIRRTFAEPCRYEHAR